MAFDELTPQAVAFVGTGKEPGIVPFGQELPAVGAHPASRALSSWRSHARAVFQSLITVRTDTPRVSAVSSTLKPPKKRNSTTWLGRGSTIARAVNASSSA